MSLKTPDILAALKRTGESLRWDGPVEVLLIGGAAGMIIGALEPGRVTLDCDLMDCRPAAAEHAIDEAARNIAGELGLPENWLNWQARQLDILPDGWRSRRREVGRFGLLHVYAAGRMDLLAMKCYANRPQDRQDIVAMKPTPEELEFVRRYLNMLRVPRRQADLDQVQSSLRTLKAIEDGHDHG